MIWEAAEIFLQKDAFKEIPSVRAALTRAERLSSPSECLYLSLRQHRELVFTVEKKKKNTVPSHLYMSFLKHLGIFIPKIKATPL